MSHSLSLHVHLPNNPNADEILEMLAIALEKDKLPPMVNSVKGFMRHVTNVVIKEQRLIAYGLIDDRLVGPVVKNSHDVLGSSLISATLMATMSGPEVGTVLSSVACVDEDTGRGVMMMVSQHGDDFDSATMTIKAPLLEYLSSENMSEALEADHGEGVALKTWTGRPQELAETMAAYLEATPPGTIH